MCGLQAECGFPGGQANSDQGVRKDAHWRPGWCRSWTRDGDKFVLDLRPAPGGSVRQVFAWSNTGSTPLRVLAPSFGQWLSGLAEAQIKRRFSYSARSEVSVNPFLVSSPECVNE